MEAASLVTTGERLPQRVEGQRHQQPPTPIEYPPQAEGGIEKGLLGQVHQYGRAEDAAEGAVGDRGKGRERVHGDTPF